MTLEIQELVIQGRVSTSEEAMPRNHMWQNTVPNLLSDEERWIEQIKTKVLEQLSEQGWGPR